MTTLEQDIKDIRTVLNATEVEEQPCVQFKDSASRRNWEMDHELLEEYRNAEEGPRKQELYRQCVIYRLL